MINLRGLFPGALLFPLMCAAQMTPEQKAADFRQLASLYAKNYAPHEWKVEAFGVDLFQIGPWLDRVARSRDDLEFYDLCIEYVASLNDAHDYLFVPSTFTATLGFSVDLYDGVTLIDSINRSQLPQADYPFAVGDELVSVDGKPSQEWIEALFRYAVAANARSTRRTAASMITSRAQELMPRAHEIGESASVVIRRAGGEEFTYLIPWRKEGLAITSAGPVASPKAFTARVRSAQAGEDDLPAYLEPLRALTNVRRPPGRDVVAGIGSRNPVFTARPEGFVQRLGRSSSDLFYSGTFEAGGFKIGYIRVPTFGPPSLAFALQQFDTEIAYFRDNTDGLIVDEMRNPGGNACYVEALLSRVIAEPFRTVGLEIRATANWVAAFANAVVLARQQRAEPWIIGLLEAMLQDVETAYRENRGRTGPMSLCSLSMEVEPLKDRSGRVLAYHRPLMILVDEMSASGGDMFPAAIQDHGRGLIAGFRTLGAGGSVSGYDATSYSEGYATVTVSLMRRKWSISSEGLPAAPFVENIGVQPDVEIDYMTRDNLRTGGRAFVDAFVKAMVEHIRERRAVN